MHAPPYENPHAGWKTLTSPHFVLNTDSRGRERGEILTRLEETHAALSQTFFRKVEIPKVEVLMFASDQDFEDVLGPVGGVYVPSVGGGPGRGTGMGVLVIRITESPDYTDRIAAHELAHRFINAKYQHVPLWFNEGFASFLETIQVSDGKILLGYPPAEVASSFAQGEIVPLRDLANAQYGQFHGAWEHRHYTTSWAFIHYILMGDSGKLRPRWSPLLEAFRAEGDARGSSLGAIERTFSGMSIGELDGRLRDYAFALGARQSVQVMPLQAFEPPPDFTPEQAPADREYIKQLCQRLRVLKRPSKL